MGKTEKQTTKIYGLRKRWLVNSLSPIFVVAVLVAMTFCVIMVNYYYNMMLDGLRTRAVHASDYFTTFSMNSYAEFNQYATRFTQEFTEKDFLEVQVIGDSGRIISSSSGLTTGLTPDTTDITGALQNGVLTDYRGVDPSTGEHIMSVCAPLVVNGRVQGALRYVTSMSAVQREILITVAVAAALLLLALTMVYVSNMVFINNVVEPVAEVTETAKRIAGGSYGAQMENHYQDEIGQLIDAINDMSGKIAKSEKIKSEFISSVSHELRTPLTAINGWAETIMNGEVRDAGDVKKGMGIIVSEARRLTNMVEELLEFSRIEDGRFTLSVEPLDLKAELEDAVYTYREFFRREGIELNYYDCEEEFPLINGDPERLRQVFCNLLDNAAKHGGSGKRIDTSIAPDGDQVAITIRDYGPGIPEEELPHVKYKFYKGSSKARGSGIGLAVCDEIVTRHEGTLDIGNAEGGGCIVTIRLPIRT